MTFVFVRAALAASAGKSRSLAAADLMDTLDGELEYYNFEHFQPGHAFVIARHFRKQQKPPCPTWKGSIVGTVFTYNALARAYVRINGEN